MTRLSWLPWLAALLVINPISFSLGANAAYQEQRRQEVDAPVGTTTFLKAGHPDPSASSSLNCLPAASGAFGGVAGCIPIPTSTADGLVDGAPSSTLGGVDGVPTTTATTPLGFLPPPPPATTTAPADPADITTYTTLPPGASFITLASGEFTSPQFITTTLPGSSSATVVPVIIPTGSDGSGGGPPVICAGCPFPAAIIIPPIGGGGGGGGGSGFCFQLFGLQIGSCPQDGNDNSGGGDDGSKPTDTPKSDKPSETTGETPTSTAQASACSISITVTYESVFCTITATNAVAPNGKKARRDDAAATGCSTQVYSTITACEEAAGATTTVTTTVEPIPVFQCNSNNCGSCDNGADDPLRLLKDKRDDDITLGLLVKRAPPDRQDPAPGKVATPANYWGPDAQALFMRGETWQISRANNKDGLVLLSPPDMDQFSTSKFILWKDVPAAIGLVGLYGCTAVVVVSQKGAWIAHFWEGEFKPETDDDTFRTNVLDQFDNGRGDMYHMFGLAQLRNSATMLGNDLVGDVFNDANRPQVFMMIPRRRITNPTVPEATRTSSTAGSDLGPAFVGRTGEVADKIRGIFGNQNLDIKQVDYSPVSLTNQDLVDALNNHNMLTQATLDRLNDKFWLEARGKLLVQFEPKAPNDCNDHNKVRVFFEDHPLDMAWPSWMTLPANPNPNPPVLAPNGELTWRRRRSLDARDEGGACELNPSSTGAPTTTEAASSGAESTPAGISPTPACLSAADGSFGGVEGCAPAPTVTSQPPAEPTSTTDSESPATTATEMSCFPPADGAFGGVASCIPGPTITQPPSDPTTTVIPTPNTSALCSSWNCQQDGSCTCQDSTPAPTPTPTLPPRSPPTCLGEAYSNNVGFERNDGVNWATDFCNSQSLGSSTLRELNPKNPKLYQNLNELNEGTWYVHISAEEGVGAKFCQAGEALTDHFDVDKCIAAFTTAIDSCAPFEWVEQDKPFVKYSAWILANCYNWTIELKQDTENKLGIGRRESVELY